MISPVKLISGFIFSLFFCLISFFIVRISDTYILSKFLDFYNICHHSSLLLIEYCNGNQQNWTEGRLIFIHTIPYLIMLLTGLYLPHMIRTIKSSLLKLSIAWLCFQMVILFSGSLIAGLVEYKGLGVPLTWFLMSVGLRITAVIILLAALTFTMSRFSWYFIRCAPLYCCTSLEGMKYWLKWVVISPYTIAFAAILIFTPLELLLNYSITFLIGIIFLLTIMSSTTKVYLSMYD